MKELSQMSATTKLIQCAWCKLYRVDGEWTAIFSPVHQLGNELETSHGVCPKCLVQLKDQLRADELARKTIQ